MRTRSESLCTQCVDLPRTFHRMSSNGVTLQREIVDALHETGVPLARAASLVGDVLGRMRAAARGELPDDSDEVDPVRAQPALWEIRWHFGGVGEFRMYHAEPGGVPDMVALRFHRKDTSSDDSKSITRLQNIEIDTAASRYEAGVNFRWGHRKRCAECV